MQLLLSFHQGIWTYLLIQAWTTHKRLPAPQDKQCENQIKKTDKQWDKPIFVEEL